VAAVEAYLAIVPVKVGMTLEPDRILGTRAQVQRQALLLDDLALALSQVREIRDLIREALGVAVMGGSDERARWLRWGEAPESSEPKGQEETAVLGTGDERVAWSQWGKGE
jgi:hypothetical protein